MGIIDRLGDCPIEDEEKPTVSPVPRTQQTDSPTLDFGQDLPAPPPAPQPPARRRRGCGFKFWFFTLLIVALGVTVWIRYFNPYVTDAQIRGYVVSIERRGVVFKTFEGELISKTAMEDTDSMYSRDFSFSVDNEEVARELQKYAGTGRLMLLSYRSYYGMLPWRGASLNVVYDAGPCGGDNSQFHHVQ